MLLGGECRPCEYAIDDRKQPKSEVDNEEFDVELVRCAPILQNAEYRISLR